MRRLTPPEPPAPCPGCGETHGALNAVNVEGHSDGAVVGDLACPECGEVLIERELLREPDPPPETRR